jgi:peptidoglycan/LPS O-acetylase OafA/YrhL
MNPNKIPVALGDSKEGRDFEKLVIWVSALSIAVMAGLLASLKQVNPEIQVRFSAATVIASVAGGILTVLFLRFVLHPNGRKRAPLVIAAVVLSVVGYFFIGIKDTAKQNRSDVMIGTVCAVLVLSCVAIVLWRLGRFFESEPKDQKPPKDEWE